jgi:hypothetical protein
MSLERSLKTLEDRLVTDPITIHYEDGSTATIPSRTKGKDHAVELLGAALRRERTRELDLLASAVKIEEPSGHLCELASAIFRSPVDANGQLITSNNSTEERNPNL